MERILITGGTGFIGSHLLKRLLSEKKYKVRIFLRKESNLERIKGIEGVEVFRGDFYNDNDLKKIVEGVDILFHLAAILARGKEEEYKKFNVEVSKKLFNYALSSGVKKIIFLSSLSVMGGSKNPHIFTENDKPSPQNLYSKSKLEVEEYISNISKKYKNKSFIIVRASAVYGPFDNFDRGFIRIIDMIKKGKFPIIGDLKNFMSLLYIDNLIDALILLMKKKILGLRIYFIADNEILTTGEVYDFICSDLGVKKKKFRIPVWLAKFLESVIEFFAKIFKFIPSFPEKYVEDFTSNYVCSIKKIRSELGWKPRFSTYEGLKRTIEWYKSLK